MICERSLFVLMTLVILVTLVEGQRVFSYVTEFKKEATGATLLTDTTTGEGEEGGEGEGREWGEIDIKATVFTG